MGNFKELKVWQKSKDLAVYLYGITDSGEFLKDHGLRDQIQRSGVSVPSNIAEGDELGSDKQSVKFFHIAKGSTAELLTQATIAYEIGYLKEEDFRHICNECNSISKMLKGLIKIRKG